ncbi:MAG: hypothetical protein WAV54_15665 [Acidimicrobiales bacterium]
MYMLQLANQHNADSQAAAERGRLVSEVRRVRQRRGEGLWATSAVRDLSRRLWGGTTVHNPEGDLGMAEDVAVLCQLPNAAEAS